MMGSMLRRAQLSGDGSTLTLDFTTGVLDPRLTFDRTSTATFINSSGLVQFANANLMTYSTPRASGSAWLTTGTVTWGSATIADPNGAATAQEVTFGTTGSAIFNSTGTTVTSGITHTFSVWLRAATGTTNVRLGSANAVVSPVTLTTTWQRFSIQYTTVNATDGGAVFSQTGTPSATFYVWGAQLQPGSTVGELLETTGTLRRNTPRFDYDPTTLAPRGLLIEGQAVNLFNWSETFDTTGGATNWNWSANVTRGTVTTTNPTGASATVIKIEETTTNGLHAPLTIPTVLASTTYTFSVWAKAVERTFVQLLENGGSGANSMVNLSTGSIVSESTAGITTVTALGTTGWYRISMRLTTIVGQTAANCQLRLSTNGTTTSYAGTTGSGIYIWGAQLETGSASSYIPTGASQVTRTADECSMTGTNFSSWFNATEGAFLAHARRMRTTDVGRIASANDNTANESIDIGASTTGQFIVTDGGSALATITPGTVTANTAFKIAGAFKLNDVQAALGGTLGTADTGVTMPTVNQLMIGRQAGASPVYLNGTVSLLKFWPTRLPDAQLQSLTT